MTDMMRLAKTTLANLKAGSINPTDEEIIAAMQTAIAKEESIRLQLLGSYDKRMAFGKQISDMIYEPMRARG